MRILAVLTVAGLALCGMWPVSDALAQRQSTKIEIVDAWARLPEVSARGTTVYLEIVNHGDGEDRLLGAASPWAERAKLSHYVMDGYNMKLQPAGPVRIKGGGHAKLSASGTFIQLENLTQAIKAGISIPITLRFEKAGPVEVEAKVANQLLGNMDR